MIETQGTDIAAAVNIATHSFTQEEGVGKAIIVITDGEDHEGGALEAAQEAKEKGMRVYVLGIGSTKGAPIPIPGTGDYMKDNTGETVMSALNEEMCKQVAEAGGGAYIHVENNSHAQEQLNTELDKLAKKEISSTIYSDYDEQFQAVGILVLLLLIAEICLLEIKNPHLKKLHLFGRKKVVTILLLLMALSVQAQSDRDYIRYGNKQYRAGKYADAEVNYRKAMEKNARNPQAYYNLGNALLAQKKDSAAIEQYQAAAKIETNARRKAWTYHNIGVICQGHQMYGEAIEAYKEALRNNPYDDETRYNLEVCKHQQKKQQQNQQNQQQQQQNGMSQQNAEQVLKAMQDRERATQQRINAQQAQQQRHERQRTNRKW
jgi:Ca-activated chloride channel family protein